MTRNYMATVVCGACGRILSLEEIRFLWSDVDWMYHHGHRVFIAERDQAAYFTAAKDLSSSTYRNGKEEG